MRWPGLSTGPCPPIPGCESGESGGVLCYTIHLSVATGFAGQYFPLCA